MEAKSNSHFVAELMQKSDITELTEMRMQSWLDMYPNAEAGVTRGWIEAQHERQTSTKIGHERIKRFEEGMKNGTLAAWVVRDGGKIIGSTTPVIEEDGTHRIGSLYVDKAYLGKGVGSVLMQKNLAWHGSAQIKLEVVNYNQRAKAFYRKWGFEEVKGSEKLHRDKIPVITMIRKVNTK